MSLTISPYRYQSSVKSNHWGETEEQRQQRVLKEMKKKQEEAAKKEDKPTGNVGQGHGLTGQVTKW